METIFQGFVKYFDLKIWTEMSQKATIAKIKTKSFLFLSKTFLLFWQMATFVSYLDDLLFRQIWRSAKANCNPTKMMSIWIPTTKILIDSLKMLFGKKQISFKNFQIKINCFSAVIFRQMATCLEEMISFHFQFLFLWQISEEAEIEKCNFPRAVPPHFPACPSH